VAEDRVDVDAEAVGLVERDLEDRGLDEDLARPLVEVGDERGHHVDALLLVDHDERLGLVALDAAGLVAAGRDAHLGHLAKHEAPARREELREELLEIRGAHVVGPEDVVHERVRHGLLVRGRHDLVDLAVEVPGQSERRQDPVERLLERGVVEVHRDRLAGVDAGDDVDLLAHRQRLENLAQGLRLHVERDRLAVAARRDCGRRGLGLGRLRGRRGGTGRLAARGGRTCGGRTARRGLLGRRRANGDDEDGQDGAGATQHQEAPAGAETTAAPIGRRLRRA
jgi:hypothetical protein